MHLHTPALKESDIGTHQMMHASDTSWGSVMNTGISSTRQSRGVQEFRNASTYATAKEIIQKKTTLQHTYCNSTMFGTSNPSSCCNCRHSLCNRCRSISFVSSMDVQSVSHEQSKFGEDSPTSPFTVPLELHFPLAVPGEAKTRRLLQANG